ncbi:hypothetical protein [Actinomadura sp. CNU-125]|uniref:hypothetical protein n=1 Tax=Actinomadura sp. CNU-125 TaxID=1904961 RepID=UPI0021CCF722|nr:hypothetical protein [Actinomadura sp. CNU-125]
MGALAGHGRGDAYAVQLLLLTGGTPDAAVLRAVERGRPHLRRALDAPPDAGDEPEMWQDKDLYRPGAIVRAAIVAALSLVEDIR